MLNAHLLRLCVPLLALSAWPAQAELSRGVHQFGSEQHCLSTGKLSSQICADAAANAAAEFEEKAPRFPSRESCESIFRAGCAIGFRGAQGYAGRRSAIYFTPRPTGFRVTVISAYDVRVSPSGPGANFSPRSAMRRDVTINPRLSHQYRGPLAAADSAARNADAGVSIAEALKRPLPPPPPVDPNFDCAAVLEPGSDPTTGCVLAPVRRR